MPTRSVHGASRSVVVHAPVASVAGCDAIVAATVIELAAAKAAEGACDLPSAAVTALASALLNRHA
jgi:hypothetical protein